MADERERPGGDPDASADELYEQAPCALLSTLPDGTIIRANQTFVAWLGDPGAVTLGETRFQGLLTIGSRIYYETHYAPLLQMQGFVNEIALEMRRADGGVSPVVASARQLRDASGKATVNRVALFDSTDRRRYEHELLLARRRAEEDARALASADARKNEFIAMLAHELRNPLAPIRSALEILRRAEHAGETVGVASEMMQRQVAQLTRLVDDLLDVSRIGQNKLTLRRVPVDLASVLHHAIETSQPLLDEKAIAFTSALPRSAVYVEADALRLAQAIGNILNNAAKYTAREGTVALVLEREETEAVIRVRDTGIGIEQAKLARVFELFMQADASADRRDGLGIGLTLARSLIERHDGQIAIHSAGRGHGTEVVIRLPALSTTLESVAPSFSKPVEDAPVASRRILVVDDNHDAAGLMALLLSSLGHEIMTAHDGLAAVEASASFAPHLVLLDIGLPKLNGYEAARRIRTQSAHRPVLVALTGWGQEEDRKRAVEAGFDIHMTKPVDHDLLLQVIANLDQAADG